MLLRRITEHVRTQNWFAVFLDFVIVVVGVFIGLQVSNWNDQRAARGDSDRTLELLIPFIAEFERNADTFKKYYATTKAYGETALRGWEGDATVSDGAFVIAAYQASQIMGSSYQIDVFADSVGAENIRYIEEGELQRLLQIYISSPSNLTRAADVNTPYRKNVRRAIPFVIQQKIRAECGDVGDPLLASLTLPPDCDIDLPAEATRAAAENLRARMDLRDDLQWHLASTQSVLFDLDRELERNLALIAAIEAYLK
ncbi:MAG: hypothetical protein AAF742_00400 [Pseudomonadota bacterium]